MNARRPAGRFIIHGGGGPGGGAGADTPGFRASLTNSRMRSSIGNPMVRSSWAQYRASSGVQPAFPIHAGSNEGETAQAVPMRQYEGERDRAASRGANKV